MDAFSFITAFIAIIPALALARVLGGLADLVQHELGQQPGRIEWSGLFLMASVLLIQVIAWNWWLLYTWHDQGPFQFWTFVFLTIKPSVYLFTARLLMPDVIAGETVDLDAHYRSVSRWVFPLIAVGVLLDVPDTLLKGVGRLDEVGGAGYLLFIAAMTALTGSMGMVRNRGFHWGVLLLLTIGFVVGQVAIGSGMIGGR